MIARSHPALCLFIPHSCRTCEWQLSTLMPFTSKTAFQRTSSWLNSQGRKTKALTWGPPFTSSFLSLASPWSSVRDLLCISSNPSKFFFLTHFHLRNLFTIHNPASVLPLLGKSPATTKTDTIFFLFLWLYNSHDPILSFIWQIQV